MKKAIFFILALLALAAAALLWLWPDAEGEWLPPAQLLGQVFAPAITADSLRLAYSQKHFRILLVPGHDGEYPGALFGNLKEKDLNLAVAHELEQVLSQDGHFQVFVTRDYPNGQYASFIADYFKEQSEEITSFRLRLRQQFLSLVSAESLPPATPLVHHNFAPAEVAQKLYGINKWANENQIDLVLHIHFNDYGGRRAGRVGEYNGLAIYVPDQKFAGGAVSVALAQSVLAELTQTVPVSSLPAESGGIIPDQELIATGANGSRDGAAMLIEYGYIYEPLWSNPQFKKLILPELGWQTYRGLKTFFEPGLPLASSLFVPHQFSGPLKEGARSSLEVLYLQKRLAVSGFYPPPSKDLHACPINGNFGPCMTAALKAFQTTENLPATGLLDEATIFHLNAL